MKELSVIFGVLTIYLLGMGIAWIINIITSVIEDDVTFKEYFDGGYYNAERKEILLICSVWILELLFHIIRFINSIITKLKGVFKK